MGADERGMVHPRGNQKRKTAEHADEYEKHAHRTSGDSGDTLAVPGSAEQDEQRDTDKDERDARGDLACEHLLMLFIPADILRGSDGHLRNGTAVGGTGTGVPLFRARGPCGKIAGHQIIEGAIEDLTHLEQLVELRRRPLGLPLGDALT